MYTIEDLNKQRKDGKITEEQYQKMARLFCVEYVGEHPDEFPEEQPSENPPGPVGLDEESVKRMIAAEVGRATNKLGNEKKELKDQLDALKQEKLTDEERAALELKEQKAEIAKREADLADKENRLYAVKAIKTAGLDDGSDKSLALVELVLAGTTEDIDTRVKVFSGLVRQFVGAEIDRLFKEKGYTPPKSGGGADPGPNPYAPKTWNVTQQWALETKDPEKASALKAAAGAKK